MEVFYVEDDKTIADSVKEYLNRQNCKAAIFETVTAVKKALQSRIPALVLIDWNLPDGEGKDMSHCIPKSEETMPINNQQDRHKTNDV